MVLHQGALYLEGTDQVSRGLDDIVGPPDEPLITLAVALGKVSGKIPPAGKAVAVALLLMDVAARTASQEN